MRDRLIELISQVQYMGGLEAKLADHLIAEGVIVPPCKVGDNVYVIDLFDFEPCKKSGECGDVCPHLYAEYGFGYECQKTIGGAKPFVCAEIKCIKINDLSRLFCYWDSFGKTVFLTREEAEKTLAERSKNE